MKYVYGVWKMSPIGDCCYGIYDSFESAVASQGCKFKEMTKSDRLCTVFQDYKETVWYNSYRKTYIVKVELNKQVQIG